MIEDYIKGNCLRIIVKAGAPKTKIIRWDNSKKALRVAVKSVAEKGKANKEVVKFLSRLLKKKISIMSGIRSREKLLKIE